MTEVLYHMAVLSVVESRFSNNEVIISTKKNFIRPFHRAHGGQLLILATFAKSLRQPLVGKKKNLHDHILRDEEDFVT